jgi:hypothetical protein
MGVIFKKLIALLEVKLGSFGHKMVTGSMQVFDLIIITEGSIPPAPPTNKNATFGWLFYWLIKLMARTRGTRGEQGFRVACNEPANDSAPACALTGQDGRFPPAYEKLN